LGAGAWTGNLVDLDTTGVSLHQVMDGRTIHIKTSLVDIG
jgi:hypothetical protein